MQSKLKVKVGILVTSTCSLCYMAFSPIIASMAAAFPDTDVSLVQMVMTLPSFLFIIFSPLAGKLAQKIRKKTLVLVGVAFYLIGGMFPFFFHNSIWLVLAGSVVIGCGSGLLMPVINAIICDNFELEERAQLMGLNATFVAIGAMLFIFVGGQLVSLFDWTYCFLAFLLMIPVLIVAWLLLPNEEAAQAEEQQTGSGFQMDPYIAFIFGIGFIYFVLQNAFNTNSSIYIDEICAGGPEAASLATLFNTLGGIIGGTVFGIIVKKLNDQIHTAALAIAGAGFLLAFLVRSLAPVLIGGALVGFAFAFYNASGTYLLSKYLKPENNSFTVSVYLAFVNVGAALSPVVVNNVSRVAGQGTAARYLVCGIVILLCAVGAAAVNLKHGASPHKGRR